MSIVGSDSSPITITVAATTPVAAASIVPTTITASATPPRRFPITSPIERNNRSATPDFSRIAPISTKNGTARSVWSDNVGNHRDGMRLIALGSNSPVRSPMNEKNNAVPAKQNATL